MNDAFRQLESLGSLDDDDDLAAAAAAAKKKVQLDEQAKAALSDVEAPSLEKEAAAFTKMLSDDDQDAYQDVMSDLGGTPKEFDAASNPSSSGKSQASRTSVSVIEDASPSQQSIPKSEEDPESFMNQAIQEALEEARSMSPTEPGGSGRKMSDSILDDEEIMKEIEEIFEKGNEKLMASLEEIRKEQVSLVQLCLGVMAAVSKKIGSVYSPMLTVRPIQLNATPILRIHHRTPSPKRVPNDASK